MPKLHYTPSRARFIIAFSQCSTKPISKVLSKLLKKIFNRISSFHQNSPFYRNCRRFCVVQNSYPLLEKMNIINSNRKAREISIFDFSALYKNLPYQDLIRVLHKLDEFSFNGGCKDKKRIQKISPDDGNFVWTRSVDLTAIPCSK